MARPTICDQKTPSIVVATTMRLGQKASPT
jgi:hypothetical protein